MPVTTESVEATPKPFDAVGFIIELESGGIDSEERLIAGFQPMIDSGVVWVLQGCYGRLARQLIENGLCHK